MCSGYLGILGTIHNLRLIAAIEIGNYKIGIVNFRKIKRF
jgi:hypothetical protein